MRYKKIIPSKQDIKDLSQIIAAYQNGDYNLESFGATPFELEKQAISNLIQNHELHKNGELEVVDMTLEDMFSEIVSVGLAKKYEHNNIQTSTV